MVGDMTGQLARAEIRLPQGGFEDCGLLRRPQPVPYRTRVRLAVHESGLAVGAIAPLPAVERRARQPQIRNRHPLRLWGSPTNSIIWRFLFALTRSYLHRATSHNSGLF